MRLATFLLLIVAGFHLSGCASTPSSPASNAGRVFVLVGASSGLGKGTALRLAEQQAKLVLAARRTELLEDLARECVARGADALPVTTDVSRDEDVARLVAAAVERFGRIDVWINFAGIGALGRFESVPLADHHRVVDVNLGGTITASHYALRRFHAQGHGTLVNISSVSGRVSAPYHASYAATKHALVGLGVALDQELRLGGNPRIRVATVLPYAVDTPWWQHAANYAGREPRMPLPDPPEKVVDAIIATSLSPRAEVVVGYKAKSILALQRIARRFTHRLAADITQQAMEEGARRAPTSGALYRPVMSGQGVRGDR